MTDLRRLTDHDDNNLAEVADLPSTDLERGADHPDDDALDGGPRIISYLDRVDREPSRQFPDRFGPASADDHRDVLDRYGVDDRPESWAGAINPGFREAVLSGDSGRLVNCADCARAVQSTLEGSPRAAAALERPWDGGGEPVDVLERWAGTNAEPTTWEDLGAKLQHDGGSAIVVAAREGGLGHAFNATRIDGTVRWIDGQTGEVGDWPPEEHMAMFGDVRAIWFGDEGDH